jgi:hypothetical protein
MTPPQNEKKSAVSEEPVPDANLVLVEVRDRVGVLTLNRPNKANAQNLGPALSRK